MAREHSSPTDLRYRERIPEVAQDDAAELIVKDNAYGASWKRRGGVGAYMMLARKLDRLAVLENTLKSRYDWDILEAMLDEHEAVERGESVLEGLRETFKDLRRYSILVEAELRVLIDQRNRPKGFEALAKPGNMEHKASYLSAAVDSAREHVLGSHEGNRYSAMHEYARNLFYVNMPGTAILQELVDINKKISPPLHEQELHKILKTFNAK